MDVIERDRTLFEPPFVFNKEVKKSPHEVRMEALARSPLERAKYVETMLIRTAEFEQAHPLSASGSSVGALSFELRCGNVTYYHAARGRRHALFRKGAAPGFEPRSLMRTMKVPPSRRTTTVREWLCISALSS